MDRLIPEGVEGGIGTRIELGSLLPEGQLTRPPSRPLPNLDLDEAPGAQLGAEIDQPPPFREAFVTRHDRFPAGQHRPPAGNKDAAKLTVGGSRIFWELNGVGAQDRVDAAVRQPASSQVAGPELRIAIAAQPGLLRGLPHRLSGKIDANQPGTGPPRDLQPIPTPPAGKVKQHIASRQPQLHGDLVNPLSSHNASKRPRRQPKIAILDLRNHWRDGHICVPSVKVLSGSSLTRRHCPLPSHSGPRFFTTEAYPARVWGIGEEPQGPRRLDALARERPRLTVKDACKQVAALPQSVKAVTATVVAAGVAVLGLYSVGGFSSPALVAPSFPNSVTAPAGYQLTYSRDFTTQGTGDWVTQPGAGATVSVNSSYGLGVQVTGKDQWAEVISSDVVVGPNSFVQGLVYIPPGPDGSTADWPAFWTTGSPWPENGEIDMLEGQEGRSCEQTHYGTLEPNGDASGNSVSNCAPLGSGSTGWITVSMWRTAEQVKVWYNRTFVGKVPLPTNADQDLIFQNQDTPNKSTGPLAYPSTAWLSRVAVWSEG
jgi:hypothetical protein